MKIAEGHNSYYLSEVGNTGVCAYVAAEKWGIHFSLQGLGRTRNNFVTFGMSPEDGIELAEAADNLLALAPTNLEISKAEDQVHANRMTELTGIEMPARGPGAPLVYDIGQTDTLNWDLVGGDLATTDKQVGSLKWVDNPDQLVVRIEEVDTLVFIPNAFRLFTAIASQKPEFQKRASIWDRAR